ncbi:hypothetical protein AB1Y20_009712 [Prymnesium parvum]|uniref:Mediator of RNA polymerase II transcription subunit 17 n=1 Tax=Prymnesium parvum TaxID=97485 RepID=A0AB34K150_PRYPA
MAEALVVEALREQRVLQVSHDHEVVEPELTVEEKHLRVLQQLPLATLLSSVDDDPMDDEPPPPPPAAAAPPARLRGPTPEAMAKLAAAHADAESAARFASMLQEQRYLKLFHVAESPFAAAPEPPEVACYRKREQVRATGAAIARGVEGLRTQLGRDRRVHAEAAALRVHWNMFELVKKRNSSKQILRLRLYDGVDQSTRPTSGFSSALLNESDAELIRDVQLQSTNEGALHLSKSLAARTLQTVSLHYGVPTLRAPVPFGAGADASDSPASVETNVASVHHALIAAQFRHTARQLFYRLSAEAFSNEPAKPSRATSAGQRPTLLHAQTDGLIMTCDLAPSPHCLRISLSDTKPAPAEGGVPSSLFHPPPAPPPAAPPPAVGALEIGLYRLSAALRAADARDAAQGKLRLPTGRREARPLLQWAHEGATHDSVCREARGALDALAGAWRDPHLRVQWRYDVAAAAAAAAGDAPPLAAAVELRAAWSERSAGGAARLRVGWALGLTIHAGQLRPHYVGGESGALDVCALFPPASLDAISISDGAHGLSAFTALVRSAMRQLFFTCLSSEAREKGHKAELSLDGCGLLLRRSGSASVSEARRHVEQDGGGEGSCQHGVQPPWVHLSYVACEGQGEPLECKVQCSSLAQDSRQIKSMKLSESPGHGELNKVRLLVEKELD